ncbi:hypothetical protein Y1Q_0020669 [Alligator mississippiensis]|uniref:Uncharacterized protein n=1 Tax=Alligator mississippiensis TaxID=8496 RepID=A0A151N0U5_ALLMI|nr:hypothetical protein Y1Q_0020669 [Alligator mississippiensis]
MEMEGRGMDEICIFHSANFRGACVPCAERKAIGDEAGLEKEQKNARLGSCPVWREINAGSGSGAEQCPRRLK